MTPPTTPTPEEVAEAIEWAKEQAFHVRCTLEAIDYNNHGEVASYQHEAAMLETLIAATTPPTSQLEWVEKVRKCLEDAKSHCDHATPNFDDVKNRSNSFMLGKYAYDEIPLCIEEALSLLPPSPSSTPQEKDV